MYGQVRAPFLSIICVIFFLAQSVYPAEGKSVPVGLSLCEATQNMLVGYTKGIPRCQIQKQLLMSGEMPYNIIVRIKGERQEGNLRSRSKQEIKQEIKEKDRDEEREYERGDYASEGGVKAAEERDVILAFCMEDAYSKGAMIKCLIDSLLANGDAAVLLFSYGDKMPYKGDQTLSGTFAFAQSLSDGASCAAVCVSFGQGDKAGGLLAESGGSGALAKRRVEVSNGGAGQTTPAVMLKTVCTSLSQAGMEYTISAGSFGALYRFRMLTSRGREAAFINALCSACGIEFYEGVEDEKAALSLSAFVHNAMNIPSFDAGGTHYIAIKMPSWLSHSKDAVIGAIGAKSAGGTEDASGTEDAGGMQEDDSAMGTRMSGRLFLFDERAIVLIFIVSSFLFTLSVCFPRKHTVLEAVQSKIEAAKRFLSVIQVLPITVAFLALSFEAGQWAAKLLYTKRGITRAGQFCVKVILSFFAITTVYCIVVYFTRPLGKTYAKGMGLSASEDVYCHLLSIVSLFNMLVFSAIDVSTVAVFAAEYIIVLIGRKAHTVLSLIISCAFMLLPYMPYAVVLSRYAADATLDSLCYSSLLMNGLCALLFVPHLMQWLRILSRLFAARSVNTDVALPPAQVASGKIHMARALVITLLLTMGVGAIVFVSFQVSQKRRNAFTAREDALEDIKDDGAVHKIDDGLLACRVHDDNFFGDTLRQLSIDTGEQCIEATVEVKGASSNIVTYCDDFYVTDDEEHTDTFRFPPYPPQKITFSFSCDDTQDAVISVNAVYDGDTALGVQETGDGGQGTDDKGQETRDSGHDTEDSGKRLKTFAVRRAVVEVEARGIVGSG